MPKYILGISAFYHDAAAALIKDGEIIAAAQEERFTRKKHDPSFPRNAIYYCLREAGIGEEDLDLAAYHDDSYKKDVKKN
jgi:carbamoyltransferase